MNSSALERARAANAERRQQKAVPLLEKLGKSFRESLEAIGLVDEGEAPASVTAAEAEQPVTSMLAKGLQRSVSRVIKTFPRVVAHGVFSRPKDTLFGKRLKEWEFSLTEVSDGMFELAFRKCPYGNCIVVSPIEGGAGQKVKANVDGMIIVFEVPDGVAAGGSFLGKIYDSSKKKEPEVFTLTLQDIRAWDKDEAKKGIMLDLVGDAPRMVMLAHTAADFDAWCAAFSSLPISTA